jgi:hypothetical protein
VSGRPRDEPSPVNFEDPVKLVFVAPNTVITVYDSPEKEKEDDYAIILVKRLVGTIIIDHFEQDRDDENVTVVYIRNNGLNGKVSRITIS